jgi:putative ABC transport system permease protein
MLISEIRQSLRRFWRNRAYTAINLLGLGVGLAFALLAMVYVEQELQYDRFHENADRIVVLEQWESPPDRDRFGSISTPLGLAPSLNEDFPEVEAATRVLWWNAMVKLDEYSSNELIHYVDPEFFEIFSWQVLSGDPDAAIQNPSSIIITASAADRFFGEESVLGRELEVQIGEEFQLVTVGAVLADPPVASTIQFDFLVPSKHLYDFMPKNAFDAWMWVHANTFALMSDGTSVEELDRSLVRLSEKHNFAERYGEGVLAYHPSALVDFRFHSELSDGLMQTSRVEYLWGISIIGLLILMVAAVNYTTLSIASSTTRVGEVGVRLVLGAGRRNLRLRLLTESILLTLIAVPLALLIVQLVQPSFNEIIGRDLALTVDYRLGLKLMPLVLILGALAGSYPAVLMSRLNPVVILKGRAAPQSGRRLLRSLVVVQFVVAVALISGTWMISQQINFMIEKQLDGRGQQVLSVFVPVQPRDQHSQTVDRFMTELEKVPGVLALTSSSNTLGWSWGWFGFNDETGAYRSFYGNKVSPGYIETHGLTLLKGRDFEPGNTADLRQSVIVNEAAVIEYGLENPLGASLPGPFSEFRIIGVVKDFHYHTLRSEIEPLVLMQNGKRARLLAKDVTNFSSFRNFIQLRLQDENLHQTVRKIQEAFAVASGEQPYHGVFLDEVVQGLYAADLSVRNIMLRATGLTVLIALLGVLGLASLNVAQRRREISIRKVLGATLLDVQKLMAGEFGLMVLAANLVALPLAYIAVKYWQQGFAYRAEFNLIMLAVLGGAMLALTLLVIATQSLRAASANPADVLRDE